MEVAQLSPRLPQPGFCFLSPRKRVKINPQKSPLMEKGSSRRLLCEKHYTRSGPIRSLLRGFAVSTHFREDAFSFSPQASNFSHSLLEKLFSLSSRLLFVSLACFALKTDRHKKVFFSVSSRGRMAYQCLSDET